MYLTLPASEPVEIAVVVNDTGDVGAVDWNVDSAELPSYGPDDRRYLVSVPAGQTPVEVTDALDALLGDYDLPDGYEVLGALVDPFGSLTDGGAR